MIVLLLNIIFFVISVISFVITRLVFTVGACIVVLVIQAFRVPGVAVQSVLEQFAGFIRGCFQFIFELAMEIIWSVMSSVFEQVKEAALGSASFTGSAIGGLVEQTKGAFDGLFTDFPEIGDGLKEMAMTVVKDLWNNYRDAIGYVTENA